ncbi:glycosyltransferase family 2 protein [Wenyingzhuangia sp. IMCC45574]
MNKVLFSVVITVYNKEKYIYDSLMSVCRQRLSPLEIIIVNDGSTDLSLLEIARINDSRIRVHTIPNEGVSNARNTGASFAKGTYIAFLDGDDVWLENHLEEIQKMIFQFPEEAVFSSATLCDKNGNLRKREYYVLPKQVQVVDYFKGGLLQSLLNPSSLVINVELYRQMGGFDVRYTNYEDIEFWFRLGLKYSVVFSIIPTGVVRITENSLSRKRINLKTCCFFEEYDSVQTDNKAFYKVLDLNRYSLALICKEYGDHEKFKILCSKINRDHLSFRKKIVLSSPVFVLKLLKKINEVL